MDELEALKEILPLVSSGGSAAVLVLAVIGVRAWNRLNAKVTRIELQLNTIVTTLRIIRPELETVLDAVRGKNENHGAI